MTAPGTDWWDLLLDTIHKALVTVGVNHAEVHKENVWSAGHLVVDVADSGYTRLLLVNNGLKEVHLDFEVSVEGKAYLKAFRGGLFSAQGTAFRLPWPCRPRPAVHPVCIPRVCCHRQRQQPRAGHP